MCTLTWRTNADGYDLYFNRDEQRSRARAHAPLYKESLDAVLPVDPDSGGTWIAVHRSGASLCLLNDYAGGEPTGEVRSRGALIPTLLDSVDQVSRAVMRLDLRCFQGFTLCVFPAGLRHGNGEVSAYHWDGVRLRTSVRLALVSSSSLDTARVLATRGDVYRHTVPLQGIGPEHLLRFHASHVPSRSQASVCMHRADAQTVSLSHIVVNAMRSTFTYYDGPPCQVGPLPTVVLPRSRGVAAPSC